MRDKVEAMEERNGVERPLNLHRVRRIDDIRRPGHVGARCRRYGRQDVHRRPVQGRHLDVVRVVRNGGQRPG
ncbi:unnamed protein product, partial [Mycena citricolor]